MNLSLIMDGTIALLLVVTIIYCAILMRKLNNLRSAQSELRQIIKGFGDAIAKAETSIHELRKAGDEAAQALDERIDTRRRDLEAQISKATELANDLEFMTDAGNKLADRLETGISDARTAAPRQGLHQEQLSQAPAASPEPIVSSPEKSASEASNGPIEPASYAAQEQVRETSSPLPVEAKSKAPPPKDEWDDIEDTEEDPDMMEELGARSEVERDLLQALRRSK